MKQAAHQDRCNYDCRQHIRTADCAATHKETLEVYFIHPNRWVPKQVRPEPHKLLSCVGEGSEDEDVRMMWGENQGMRMQGARLDMDQAAKHSATLKLQQALSTKQCVVRTEGVVSPSNVLGN